MITAIFGVSRNWHLLNLKASHGHKPGIPAFSCVVSVYDQLSPGGRSRFWSRLTLLASCRHMEQKQHMYPDPKCILPADPRTTKTAQSNSKVPVIELCASIVSQKTKEQPRQGLPLKPRASSPSKRQRPLTMLSFVFEGSAVPVTSCGVRDGHC